MVKSIYLDNAASTPIDKNILRIYNKALREIYANPSSIHGLGEKAQKALQEARKKIANILKCKAEEIIFTSGGTESNNLAIKGIAFNHKPGSHIITSKIEHPSVIETCKFLESQGYEITYLDVNNLGIISLDQLKSSIKKSTILISIIYANNEIGTIQPIKEIGKIAKLNNVLFHVDACQAPGLAEINVNSLGVDLMTLNSSKVYAPKGAGLLFKKSNVKIRPLFHGGKQELGLRAGTENVPAIVAFAEALEQAEKEKDRIIKQVSNLRDYFISELIKLGGKLNGHPFQRLANNINITLPGMDSESLLLYLSENDIYCSQGSACDAKKDSKHVLIAIGLSDKDINSTLRFTLSKYTTRQDINKTIKEIMAYLKKN